MNYRCKVCAFKSFTLRNARDHYAEHGHAVVPEVDYDGSPVGHKTAMHECGMCNEVLFYDGMQDGYDTWMCSDPGCGWWHISKDCCDSGPTPAEVREAVESIQASIQRRAEEVP